MLSVSHSRAGMPLYVVLLMVIIVYFLLFDKVFDRISCSADVLSCRRDAALLYLCDAAMMCDAPMYCCMTVLPCNDKLH